MGVGGCGGCRARPETRRSFPGGRGGVGLPRRRLLPLVPPPPPELRLPRNGRLKGRERRGARGRGRRESLSARRSRRPQSGGVPGRPGRPTREPAATRARIQPQLSGRACGARGLGGPRVAAAAARRRRRGACAARAGRRGGEGPARLPSTHPGFSPWRWSLGDRRRHWARWSPSRAEPESPPPPPPPLPGSLPARRPGCGGQRAAGARADEGRALRSAPETGPSAARPARCTSLHPTLAPISTPSRSAAPQLRSTWRKEEEGTLLQIPHAAPLLIYLISSRRQPYFFSTHWQKTPKLRSNFSKKREAKRASED
ncbi:translation initiation factor IF-2-like [Phocoena sinus]|uniref:translation initiation factor IF-2-like n=1 Tax=Phocoena sinus TaxID=42100 RepID=UPI0013C504CD|nr:translation initiation factor IF-2-like [Phocoena sinus]